MKTEEKKDYNKIAYFLIIAIVVVTSVLLISKKSQQENNQRIDITMKLQTLNKGDSMMVTDLTHAVVFDGLKEQIKHSKELITGENKIQIGFLKYNWTGHRLTGLHCTDLKELYIADTNNVRYKIIFKKDYAGTPTHDYPTEFMTVTRYWTLGVFVAKKNPVLWVLFLIFFFFRSIDFIV